eukprot:1646590-Rhodomonas_salina.1
MAQPSVAVKHVVAWQEEGRHAIVGSYRSAVTGPLALAASIESTPVIVWSASATSLSDRDTYPTLSRLNLNDLALAKSIVQVISMGGWKEFGLVYLDDAWGRGMAQNLLSSVSDFGIEILQAAPFALGDEAGIEDAVRQVAQSRARVLLSLAFDSDLEALTASADRHGLLGQGYTWISLIEISPDDVIAASADPQKTRERLTGWLVAAVDLTAGGLGTRFQSQLESEPLQHLNHSI